jgi:lysine 2,3-aminomutase
MSDWQKTLHQSIDNLEKLKAYVADRFGPEVAEREIDVEALQPAFDNFQMRITPAMLDLMQEPGDAMWNQFVPTTQELDIVDGVIDSLDEDGDSPVPNITHRYPDRVLFLVSPVCAAYCRFCTRRRKVGDPEKIPLNQYDSAFEYIASHPEYATSFFRAATPCCCPIAGWSTSSRSCARFRTWRSSVSAAASRRICPSGSRRSSARW